MLKCSRDDCRDAGADALQAPSAHQPPRWVGWLLLLSLLVMLNTHLFITLAVGTDQYGLYGGDPYPSVLAQKPYTILVSLGFSVLCAFIAYGAYRYIWWRFTTPRALTPNGHSKRNPFQQNAIAMAMSVSIAMLPSFLLSYTVLKPYFIIVGALIAIVLCIVGALKDPDVELHPSTRGYWFNVAVTATFVMMALAVIVTFYFQYVEPAVPGHNMLWELNWQPDSMEEFNSDVREGMFLFGLVSIAYMVVALGGVLLATLHSPRIGSRSKEIPPTTQATLHTSGPAPEYGVGTPNAAMQVSAVAHPSQVEPQAGGLPSTPEPAFLHDANLPSADYSRLEVDPLLGIGPDRVNTSLDDAEEERAAEILRKLAEEWAAEVLRKLDALPLEKGHNPSHLVVLSSGLERHVSAAEYRVLVDERSGILQGVDLFVDQSTGVVKIRKGSGLEHVAFNPTHQNHRYRALCLYARTPDLRLTIPELQNRLGDLTGQKPSNTSDIVYNLKVRDIPLESENRLVKFRDGTKIFFVDRLRTRRARR